MATLPVPHPKRLPTHAETRLAQSAIEELDKGIGRLRAKVKELQKKIRGLQHKKANHVSFISPFRRIPAEVLAEIALMCLHTGDSLTKLTQINSNFRDAVIGTASIWRHVRITSGGRFEYNLFDGSIGCETKEQLEVVLARTNKAPLTLIIDSTVEPELIKLIKLHGAPIESLTVSGQRDISPAIDSFLGLDLGSLQELIISRVSPELAKAVMGLAWHSTFNGIHLSLQGGIPPEALLTHPFAQRVTKLLICNEQVLSAEHDQPIPTDIPLPNVKSCHLLYDATLVGMLELSGVQDFGFIGLRALRHDHFAHSMITRPPPRQVRTMQLRNCVVNFGARGPYRLPNLTELELEDVDLCAPLQNYLDFPKIKKLALYNVNYSGFDDEDEDTIPIIGKAFFRNTPELEELSVGGTLLGSGLILHLPYCASLKSLWLYDCVIDEFIDSFVEQIGDKKFFPSLEELTIRDSWPRRSHMSFMKFSDYCESLRPTLVISGNGSRRDY